MSMQNLFKCKLGTTLLILPLILVACTNHTQLTFVSQPYGAMITEISAGNKIGIAPTAKSYDAASMSSVDSEGCYKLNGVEALWVSGAVERMPELKLCDGIKVSYTVTLFRPLSYPDWEKDLAVEKQLKLLEKQLNLLRSSGSGFRQIGTVWHRPGRSGNVSQDIRFQRSGFRGDYRD